MTHPWLNEYWVWGKGYNFYWFGIDKMTNLSFIYLRTKDEPLKLNIFLICTKYKKNNFALVHEFLFWQTNFYQACLPF